VVILGTPRQPALLTAPSRLMAYGGPSDDGRRWLESDDDYQTCPTCYRPMTCTDTPDGKHGMWTCRCGQPPLYVPAPVYLGPIKPRLRAWDEVPMKEAGSPLRVWQTRQEQKTKTTSQTESEETTVVKLIAPVYIVLEDGMYNAIFRSAELQKNNEGKDYLRWNFDVQNEDTGKWENLSGMSSTNFGAKSKPRAWIEGMTATRIEDGDDCDLDDLINTKCRLVVSSVVKDNGTFNNIDRILPAKRGKAARAPVRVPAAADDADEEAF